MESHVSERQICNRCVMDTSDPNIKFDEQGICNHCKRYFELVESHVLTGDEAEQELNKIADEIREDGKKKEYDCVIGISGGIDSTYNAYIAKKLRLRPLAVHLDNGWNSELAVHNIELTLKNLDIDLYTHIIDWEEFRDLQVAYLKSGIINIEALTDHAIWAVLHKTAVQYNVNYILGGTNFVTEGILPSSWGYDNKDLVNIMDIQKKYGAIELNTFPTMSSFRFLYYRYVKGIKWISLLNYVRYVKNEIKPFLAQELGWKDYSGKHGESVFTYFYQSHMLKERLNVDKRRAHLSCMVCAGEITREEALRELDQPLYTDHELREIKEYVVKKLQLSEEEFDNYMHIPPRNPGDFKTDKVYKLLRYIVNTVSYFKKFKLSK